MTYGDSDGRVLGEQNSLGLNDEEIDQLLEIIKIALKGFLGNLVVSTRSE